MPYKDLEKRRVAIRKSKMRPEYRRQQVVEVAQNGPARRARWKARHPEWKQPRSDALKARLRRYYTSDKGKACIARWNAKRRSGSHDDDLTNNEWHRILETQNGRCALCFMEFGVQLAPTRDHIVPLSRGGRLTASNVQALCKPCNSRKHNHDLSHFELV